MAELICKGFITIKAFKMKFKSVHYYFIQFDSMQILMLCYVHNLVELGLTHLFSTGLLCCGKQS